LLGLRLSIYELLDIFCFYIDGIYSHSCCCSKWILFLNLDLLSFIELVRTKETQYRVFMVSEYDITLGVELDKNVASIFSLTELKVYDSVYSQLSQVFQLFGSQVLSKLHGETRRHVFLIPQEIRGMDSDS
jgi:hypothetical protein